jgi:thioredoxin reductase/polyferredoxin
LLEFDARQTLGVVSVNLVRKYANWLHTRWPAGRVEPLPVADADGRTNVPGLYIAGDLRGVPLLKFAADTGARAVRAIAAEAAFQAQRHEVGREDGVIDLAILGAGVAGMAAALEARAQGLVFEVFEASEPFSTIVNFPRRKPIFTYPHDMTPAGSLVVSATIKEALVEELRAQTVAAGILPVNARVARVARAGARFDVTLADGTVRRARRVICALGRSGDFRRLGVPGEELDKVANRLHDPKDCAGQRVLVVGGGDSALETAVALAQGGAEVTLAYRGADFVRPKHENIAALEREAARGRVRVARETTVTEIRAGEVVLARGGIAENVPNDAVFVMIGREAPLDFFRRSGVAIAGEWRKRTFAAFAAFVLFCVALYNWKSGGILSQLTYQHGWFPVSLADTFAVAQRHPGSLLGVLVISASTPSFWYTLAYSLIVAIFGVRRIQRRRTTYITVQTATLMAIQVLPLFLLPEILLPWIGHHGLLPQGLLDALFPVVDYGHGREYWRAYGLILAWPLNVYNVFTSQPLGWWLAIAFAQTFVAIPLLIYYFGKGAYCGWICSCGALAETLGDTLRHKMPHGPRWNRLNLFGQALLAVAFVLLAVRIVGWTQPADSGLNRYFFSALDRWKWVVDVFLAGVIGYGFYFWFSGRVWCRFMCPLAALMHVYARLSRFRIVADKKKCISCNVCTTVCHQGIDIMSFANKGEPMADPECVRCSACVQSCPTGVLTFAQVGRDGRVLRADRLAANPVQMRETSADVAQAP